MSTFVLVHGAWHGAWCWHKIIPRLEAKGHRVVAPDLPGHGTDNSPVGGLSFNDFAESIESILDTLDEAVILVGHSMGGFVVQLVGQHQPEKVAALVYLATGAIADGETPATDELMSAGIAEAFSSAIVDEQAGTVRCPADEATRMFYGDCDAEDIALALLLLVPDSVASLTTPIERTQDRYGSLHRYAIITMNDSAIPAALQWKTHKRDGITDIVTLSTSHSPFFSQPDELTRHLLDIAARVPATRSVWDYLANGVSGVFHQ
jgi:pimeloyl-ACP methyl ester carboxylesterase